MGVRGLMSWLRPHSSIVTFEKLLNKPKSRIAIDISYYMYKWQADEKKIIDLLDKLLSAGHRVILVFDGRAADGKQWEVQRRRTAREEEQKAASSLQNELDTNEDLTPKQKQILEKTVAEHQRRGWQLTKDLRHNLKRTLYDKGIPMIKATTEADGLLAAMSNRGDIDIVISGDMDVFAMGTKQLYAPTGDGTSFMVFEREEILKELDLTDYQFRSMCAMCFTEMREEQEYLDVRQAYQGLRVFRSFDVLKKKHPEWLKVWPQDDHIFYHSVDTLEEWLREDQKVFYAAFQKGEIMPYE